MLTLICSFTVIFISFLIYGRGEREYPFSLLLVQGSISSFFFQDGVICLIYLGLFCLAVLIALIDAARFDSVALGIAVVSLMIRNYFVEIPFILY